MRGIQSSFVLQTTKPEIRFQWCGRKRFPTSIANTVPKTNVWKHAQKLICVDATHGTTAYHFQLVTVLVTDDYNEGVPVAWLISNKETTDALKIFFSSLRERCGEVQTETFMSDDTDAYYNTWVSTFSRPDRKLLCRWHVDRSWQRKLNEHLKDKEQMVEVYAALKSLQNELSETSFRRSLQHFMAWIKGKSKPLAKYFEKKYVGRTREWAACFWVGSWANTNMFVECFHRTLMVYPEKKQNRRVDHLIFKIRDCLSLDLTINTWKHSCFLLINCMRSKSASFLQRKKGQFIVRELICQMPVQRNWRKWKSKCVHFVSRRTHLVKTRTHLSG